MDEDQIISRKANINAEISRLKLRISELQKEFLYLNKLELSSVLLADRIIYAAYARCLCGAGLAYDPCDDEPTCWDCSKILTGQSIRDETHVSKMSFLHYDITSENQSGALGATTRPPQHEQS